MWVSRLRKTAIVLNVLGIMAIVTMYSVLAQYNFVFLPSFHFILTPHRILSPSPPSSAAKLGDITRGTNQTRSTPVLHIGILRKKQLFKQRRRFSQKASSQEVVKKFQYPNVNNLRFLSFGTSRTWGSGLEQRLEDAYPYLLSRNATNLAMRATGPNIPALCTYSMVGDHRIYDVITLEYHLRSKHKLRQLAFRLRQRFPDATIIFVLVRHPFQFIHKQTQKSLRDFIDQAILENQNQQKEENDADFLNHAQIIESILQKTRPQDWEFREHTDAIEEIHQISAAVKGHIFQVDFPQNNDNDDNIYHAIRFFAKELYILDLVHYSEYGHRVVASGIVAILEANQVKRSDTVNEWIGRDDCHSWLSTGKTGENLQHDANLIMRSFRRQKYALEVTANDTCIMLNNHDVEDGVVYVGYMATSERGIYPKMRLQLHKGLSNDNIITTTTSVDPTTSAYLHPVHISETIEIGSIPLGQSKVTFSIMENNTQYPFRVTGILVTPSIDTIFLVTEKEAAEK